MEKNCYIKIEENIENFNNILNNFFERKEITIYNYIPLELDNLENLLKINFNELKIILSEKKNIEILLIYMKEKKEKSWFELETCIDYLKYDFLCLENVHYINIIQFLEEKQKNLNPKFDLIDENFFVELREQLFYYFIDKRRMFNEKEI